MSYIAEILSHKMTEFSLKLGACPHVTDEGLSLITRPLPECLLDLDLDLDLDPHTTQGHSLNASGASHYTWRLVDQHLL